MNKILKNWLPLFFGGTIRNMEDLEKVENKINELTNASIEAGEVSPKWGQVNGYVSLVNFSLQGATSIPVFNANVGLPVKAFLNSTTGEVKIFSAYMFEK